MTYPEAPVPSIGPPTIGMHIYIYMWYWRKTHSNAYFLLSSSIRVRTKTLIHTSSKLWECLCNTNRRLRRAETYVVSGGIYGKASYTVRTSRKRGQIYLEGEKTVHVMRRYSEVASKLATVCIMGSRFPFGCSATARYGLRSCALSGCRPFCILIFEFKSIGHREHSYMYVPKGCDIVVETHGVWRTEYK